MRKTLILHVKIGSLDQVPLDQVPIAMECPHCHSDDVKRSRRKFHERLVLPLLRAHVVRCRDCKKRFWIDVQWSSVILGFLTIAVTAGVITGVVMAHETRTAESLAAARKAQVKRLKVRRMAIPKGLPPLSRVARPADDPEQPAKQ